MPSNADGLFGDERDDQLARALGGIIAACREEWQHEIARETTILRNENAELRGMLNATLTMIGAPERTKSAAQNSHDDSVVELPRFLRKVHDNG